MKSLAQLNKYFLKYKWRFLLGIIFVIAQNFFAIYPAQLVRKSLDAVIFALKEYQANSTGHSQLISSLSTTIMLFLLMIIGVGILREIGRAHV